MKQIRLELARSAAFPAGDPRHGYVFRAPLAADGRLDERAFKPAAQLCVVHRFSPDAADETGQLIHTSRGWAFSYAPGEDDDEAIYRLGTHSFKPGEYVTITEHDGKEHTFRVVTVEDAPAAAGRR
jgi:hypothetical protein